MAQQQDSPLANSETGTAGGAPEVLQKSSDANRDLIDISSYLKRKAGTDKDATNDLRAASDKYRVRDSSVATLNFRICGRSHSTGLYWYQNSSLDRRKLLDVVQFLTVHQLLFAYAQKSLRKVSENGSAPVTTFLARSSRLLQSMYHSIDNAISSHGTILPYLSKAIDEELLINLYACLNIHPWDSTENFLLFKSIAHSRLILPCKEFFRYNSKARKYYTSILTAVSVSGE